MSTSPPSAFPGGPATFLGSGLLEDPYPLYAMLRRANPVFQVPVPVDVGAGVFLLTRYADVQRVLRDSSFSADRLKSDAIQRNRARLGEALLLEGGLFRSILTMDPPDHTRVRGLVSKAFTPRRVAGLRSRIETITSGLLDGGLRDGRLDVMEGLAMPLPAIVIAELLGVPAGDWPRFRQWAADIVAVGNTLLSSGPDGGRLRRGLEPLQAYLRGIIAERRREARDDLISAMVAAQEDRDALTDEEMLTTAVILLIAGHETTTNLIGNGVWALLCHPEELARLRREPERMKSAVEEMLRFDSPVQGTVRVATQDVEFGGRRVPQGALLVCGIGAANRDPEAFPDPDRFDIGREDNHHLSFGFGAHFCLGAPLARLEGEVAIRALLERLPSFALDAERVQHRPNPILRGLLSLPLRAGSS